VLCFRCSQAIGPRIGRKHRALRREAREAGEHDEGQCSLWSHLDQQLTENRHTLDVNWLEKGRSDCRYSDSGGTRRHRCRFDMVKRIELEKEASMGLRFISDTR
jgi:hypothetical protein